MNTDTDTHWMRVALQLAGRAVEQDEVPVGAIVVRQGEVIGAGWNCPIASRDPTAHAEIIAIRDAASRTGNYRLVDSTLYVTLEPCLMCAGAMVHARIGRLVFGANDPKRGAVDSTCHAFESQGLNHRVQTRGGVLAQDCGTLLQDFFRRRRG